jgi:hypothetical protein
MPAVPKNRSWSDSGSNVIPQELQQPVSQLPGPKTAALEFEEFSYVNDEGTIDKIGIAWLEVLVDYLAEHYGAQSVSENLPYLIVWCEDEVPLPSERPFLIAGLVAIWRVHGKDEYPMVRFGSQLPSLRFKEGPMLILPVGDILGRDRPCIQYRTRQRPA